MNKFLHIICLDVPLPANYGGAIDQFYKIVWLHQHGVKINLHCFTTARQPQDQLKGYCESVTYYPRKKSIRGLSFGLPYIVSSRQSDALIKNLEKDEHPILMEGVHCTYPLYKNLLPGRKVFVRLHNVEFNYYKNLAKHEFNWFKKIYYYTESLLLKRYEKKIAPLCDFWALSEEDLRIYEQELGCKRALFLPAFHAWQEVQSISGRGLFCLYHGNLAVNENEQAVIWLAREVFAKMKLPFVIAGNKPSHHLEQLLERLPNACLVANPSDKELQDLIHKAQVNILPSLNNTGVKLKLLNALFNGRFCVVNEAATAGSHLQHLCVQAETPAAFMNAIQMLYDKNYGEEQTSERKEALEAFYDNSINAQKIINWIY